MLPDREAGNWFFRVTWVALILVLSLAIGDAVLTPTPAPRQPDFIDAFLASRAVVIAIRIALIFAAAFVVLSVVALIVRRQWLTRVGPVEVSEEVSGVRAEIKRLEEELGAAQGAIDALENLAAHTQQVVHKGRDL